MSISITFIHLPPLSPITHDLFPSTITRHPSAAPITHQPSAVARYPSSLPTTQPHSHPCKPSPSSIAHSPSPLTHPHRLPPITRPVHPSPTRPPLALCGTLGVKVLSRTAARLYLEMHHPHPPSSTRGPKSVSFPTSVLL